MRRISVIVPFYNTERHIGKCIESLLAQDYPKDLYEIILVDNNSKDGSASIVRRYPVKLLCEKKQGAYAARNAGLSNASGEIVAFTDPDCVVRRDWLKNISHALQMPPVKIVIGPREPGRDTSTLTMISAYENMKDEFVFSNDNGEIYYGHTNNMATDREAFDSVGPFVEEQRGSDTLFVCSVVKKYSSEVVVFSWDVSVRHLELDRLPVYFRKVYTYAKTRRLRRSINRVKHLSYSQRLKVFQRVVRSKKLSFVDSSVLFVLLLVGWVYWILGGLHAAWLLCRKSHTDAI